MVRKGMAGEHRPSQTGTGGGLLDAADPPAVGVINPFGRSPFLLIGDHAGNRIPAALGTLGLSALDRGRHIAWDIGVGALGVGLSAALDAVFVRQVYSRLVIDCNRDPAGAEAIPEASDGTPIPDNIGLSAAQRTTRIAAIHAPYQHAIATEIARRDAAGQDTVLVSLHSFTPEMDGVARPWDVGVLHDGGRDQFARALLAELRMSPALVVGDNAPYRMDATDHTVPRHAAGRLRYVELEIAQRVLQHSDGITGWTAILAAALDAAMARESGR